MEIVSQMVQNGPLQRTLSFRLTHCRFHRIKIHSSAHVTTSLKYSVPCLTSVLLLVGHAEAFFHIYGLANQKLLRWRAAKKVSFPIGACARAPAVSLRREFRALCSTSTLYARSSKQEIYADTAATTNSCITARQRRQMNQGSLRKVFIITAASPANRELYQRERKQPAQHKFISFLGRKVRAALDGELELVCAHTERGRNVFEAWMLCSDFWRSESGTCQEKKN